jgi:hypothetical protein
MGEYGLDDEFAFRLAGKVIFWLAGLCLTCVKVISLAPTMTVFETHRVSYFILT